MKKILLFIKRYLFEILLIIAGVLYVSSRKKKKKLNHTTEIYEKKINKINKELEKIEKEKSKPSDFDDYDRRDLIAFISRKVKKSDKHNP